MGIFITCLLLLVFVSGAKQEFSKSASAMMAHLIAIPLAGISYQLLAALLSFLSGDNWDNLVGFFAAKYLIIIILYLSFLFFVKRFNRKAWKKGILTKLAGGTITAFNSAIGLTTLTLTIEAYPVSGWFGEVILGSSFLDWLVSSLSFVRLMLPFA